MKSVSTQWAKAHVNEINLIDVRTPGEYASNHIPGSKNIPMTGLILNHGDFLKPNETYYIMCHAGNRSKACIEKLEPLGYDLVQVEGGISALD